jgi:hypothetical protein
MPFTLLPLTSQLYGPQTYLYEPKDLCLRSHAPTNKTHQYNTTSCQILCLLSVILVGFKEGSAEVDSKVVFRRLFVLVVYDVLVALEAN